MNLLVLRLATINAEEQVQERLEAAEARRNAVHLEGDVIQPNTRLFNTTEKPEQVETISVCSCACLDYKIWHHHNHSHNQTTSSRGMMMHNHHQQQTSAATTTAATKNMRGQRRRSTIFNSKFKDESSVVLSESGGGGGGSGGSGRRSKWSRHAFLTPTLKRLLPAPLHRRLNINNNNNTSSKSSQYGIPSNPNSHEVQNNENEFEMMIKHQHKDDDDDQLRPAEQQKLEQPLSTTTHVDENNLLNLDAIDLCSSSSNQVKRKSI